MIAGRVLLAAACTAGIPAALLGWLWLAERVERLLPPRRRPAARAWLWLAPAGAPAAIFLLWPLAYTAVLSFRDATGAAWRGAANYAFLLDSSEVHAALRNNLLWLVLLTAGCLLVALTVAVLSDAVRWEPAAKAIVVAPTAISFVCGAVIWRFMFQYQPPGLPQTGTLNAAWTGLTGSPPVPWLVDSRTNNAALVAVGVWMTAGFAAVIISAALKGLPAELVEAARIDGANAWQVFRYITLPQLRPTLVVVATLLAIMALKAFDIVYVMTNGNYDTDVIANLMYRQLFVAQDYGRASAVAVLLAVIAAPIFLVNASVIRNRGSGR
jgi:alpha-glucoside transport system permease protein